MRAVIAILAICLPLSASSAWAYEKFIPLGHSYAPDQAELPPLNSEVDRMNAQVDILESSIYQRERSSKQFQSDMNRFMNDRSVRPVSNFIDY